MTLGQGHPCTRRISTSCIPWPALFGSATITPMLPDWIELCALFNAHRVEYLVVGGQAVIAHGHPRLTKDMDLWVTTDAW